MDNKKFEKLIDLIINEDEEQARAMFHDIVVEKSREIYENLMADEMGEGMGGQVGGLLDEISAEEEGMTEEEDEFADIEVDDDSMGDEEGTEMSHDDMDGMDGEEGLEDRVVDLEDKLDELMAEFEQLMGGEEGEEHEEGSDEEQDDEDMMESDEEQEDSLEEAKEEDDEEEDTLEEAIQLKKVSVTHGDNGQNTKSVVSNGSKVQSNGAKAVNAFGGDEKGGTVKAPATIPGKYKNAPGQDGSKTEAAPKAKGGDDGVNTKSPLGESKKTTKKIVK